MKWFINCYQNEQGLLLYKQFNALNNDITNLLALKACINLNDMQFGNVIIEQHSLYTDRNIHSVELRNILMQFYAHFGDLEKALYIFNDIENKNIVVINCMLQILVNNNRNIDAVKIYKRFQNISHLIYDDMTYLFGIKACLNICDIAQCHNIITENIFMDYSNHSIELLNGIINFYGNITDIKAAENVYDITIKNGNNTVSTVNSIMQRYINNELYINALNIYKNNIDLIDNICNVFAIKCCINTNDF